MDNGWVPQLQKALGYGPRLGRERGGQGGVAQGIHQGHLHSRGAGGRLAAASSCQGVGDSCPAASDRQEGGCSSAPGRRQRRMLADPRTPARKGNEGAALGSAVVDRLAPPRAPRRKPGGPNVNSRKPCSTKSTRCLLLRMLNRCWCRWSCTCQCSCADAGGCCGCTCHPHRSLAALHYGAVVKRWSACPEWKRTTCCSAWCWSCCFLALNLATVSVQDTDSFLDQGIWRACWGPE